MICAIAFHSGDVAQAVDLIDWIKLLGGCPKHDCLLVADSMVQWSDCLSVREMAQESFQSVEMIVVEPPRQGWPMAANAMFLAAAHHLAGKPFFWCEPDCIPLRAGWLDELGREYEQCGKPFMGAFVRTSQPGLPSLSLAGCAVYPADAAERIGRFCDGPRAWDVASAEAVIPQAASVHLIQHFFGQIDLAPTFAPAKTPHSPVNTFTLDHLRKEAVVFHRNKDGTLIRLLNKRDGIFESGTELVVVFPFCLKDEMLLNLSLEWMEKMDCRFKRIAVLHYDNNVNAPILEMIKLRAERIFERVMVSRYPTPPYPFYGWPGACNWAFRMACQFIESNHLGSWFWLEADAVALVQDWLDQIEMEYGNCGKPFMGTVFPNNTHMNGVGVYPEEARSYAPCLGSSVGVAWDFGCGSQVVPHAHNASHLIQHYNNGREMGPTIFTPQNLSYINPSSVVYHACKNNSLIHLLSSSHA